MAVPEKSDNLLAGRRAIDGINGVELLGDYEWFDEIGKWALSLRITVDALAGQPFEHTAWYALVDDAYPWGSLKIFPAVAGGIQSTYAHQNLNLSRTDDLPWRTGDACLVGPLRQHGGGYDTQEPVGSVQRLLWHVGRLSEWIMAAATGQLTQSGDAYELPPFPGIAWVDKGVVYAEGEVSFATWQGISQRYGVCDLVVGRNASAIVAIKSWSTLDGHPLRETEWGTAFEEPESPSRVFWIMLDAVPILRDWAPPMTWSELHSAVEAQGLKLEVLLRPIVSATAGKGGSMLLVGFPIPRHFGETDCEVYWLALNLPEAKGRVPDGFRNNALGYWMAYMRNVVGPQPIEWLPAANWDQLRLASRGQLEEGLRRTSVAIIGAGALGSALAELLARGGVSRLTIIDGELMEAGNLARHVLGLDSLGKTKAEALAGVVASVSPHVRVEAIPRDFEVHDRECVQAIQAADIVIDCTGDDRALVALSEVTSGALGALWLSASMSHGADSMYVFAAPPNEFTFDSYVDLGSAWLDEQQERLATEGVVFEGPGCWHPAFPGRNHDIRLLVAMLPRALESLRSSPRRTRVGLLGRIDSTSQGLSVLLTCIEETP